MSVRRMKLREGKVSGMNQFLFLFGTVFIIWFFRYWYHSPIEELIETKAWQGSSLSSSSLISMKDDGITSITLTGGDLSSIPSQIGLLVQLTNLNAANNKLAYLPSEIGLLSNLEMLGLKNNLLKTLPSEIGLLSNLKAIFLTENVLEWLPSEIGNMKSLRKFQAGSNHLKSIPSEIGNLINLELLRLPMNKLESLPPTLMNCVSLAWPAFSGNPIMDRVKPLLQTIKELNTRDISLGTKNLASVEYGGATNNGVIIGHIKLSALISDQEQEKEKEEDRESSIPVVVKYYHDQVSPDGDPWEELLIGAAIMHQTSEPVRSDGIIMSNHYQHDHALSIQYGYLKSPRLAAVLRLVPDSKPLAKKPLDQVKMLRGRFEHQKVEAEFLLGAISDIVDGLSYLHSLNIAHGDIYAHNVLVHQDGLPLSIGQKTPRYAILFDFGASFFYSLEETSVNSNNGKFKSGSHHQLVNSFIEGAEVRAFGLLLHDMITYLSVKDHYSSKDADWLAVILFLGDVSIACTDGSMRERPSFSLLSSVISQLRSQGPMAARKILNQQQH